MKKKTEKQTEGPDIKGSDFWDSMGFELLKVKKDGRILVKDKITGSDMKFSTSWSPFRIAKTISNARAQYLK